MLNISKRDINLDFHQDDYHSLRHVDGLRSGVVLKKILVYLFLAILVIMFIPWTQNIRADGNLTALMPGQRPQTIQAIIDGRLEKWYVQEGDYVNKGDLILHISEIKADYLDPDLVKRTEGQVKAKQSTAESYKDKVQALEDQIVALKSSVKLKLTQAQNKLTQSRLKVISDSMDLVAADVNANIAKGQFERMEKLYEDGLKSLTAYENRKNKHLYSI